jgi:hypothetical protein
MMKVIPFLALTLAVAASLVPLATGAPAETQTVRVNATSYKITLSKKAEGGHGSVRRPERRRRRARRLDPRRRPERPHACARTRPQRDDHDQA